MYVHTRMYPDAFAYSIILALSTGGLTVCYIHVCSSVSRGPGCSAFLFLFLFLSFYSSFSLRLLAMLSPSFSPERPIASQWRRINCAGVLGAPLLLANWRIRHGAESSLFVQTWLPVSSSHRAKTHIRTALLAARGDSLGTESPQDLFAGQGCRVFAGNPIAR